MSLDLVDVRAYLRGAVKHKIIHSWKPVGDEYHVVTQTGDEFHLKCWSEGAIVGYAETIALVKYVDPIYTESDHLFYGSSPS